MRFLNYIFYEQQIEPQIQNNFQIQTQPGKQLPTSDLLSNEPTYIALLQAGISMRMLPIRLPGL